MVLPFTPHQSQLETFPGRGRHLIPHQTRKPSEISNIYLESSQKVAGYMSWSGGTSHCSPFHQRRGHQTIPPPVIVSQLFSKLRHNNIPAAEESPTMSSPVITDGKHKLTTLAYSIIHPMQQWFSPSHPIKAN